MARDAGASDVDDWMTRIAEFMTSVGTIPEAPDAASYIDPTHIQGVAEDQALADFVNAD